MKKFITGILVGAIIVSSAAFAATYIAESASFKVMVNGEEFHSDPPALVINGSTYLPLRAMGNALGVPVKWNSELNQAEVGNQAPVADKNQYSRNNPAPIDTVQTYTKTNNYIDEYNYSVSVRVMEMVRGEAALEALKAKSKYYLDPDDGYEYVNVKVAFSVNKTKGDFSVNTYQDGFKAFSANNEKSPDHYYTSIDPILEGQLYEGGNTEGWITLQVKKDDPKPKLAYGLDYNGAGGVWFALYE